MDSSHEVLTPTAEPNHEREPEVSYGMAGTSPAMTVESHHAAFTGMRWFGVELEIFISSSFMSTPMSPNSGVDR